VLRIHDVLFFSIAKVVEIAIAVGLIVDIIRYESLTKWGWSILWTNSKWNGRLFTVSLPRRRSPDGTIARFQLVIRSSLAHPPYVLWISRIGMDWPYESKQLFDVSPVLPPMNCRLRRGHQCGTLNFCVRHWNGKANLPRCWTGSDHYQQKVDPFPIPQSNKMSMISCTYSIFVTSLTIFCVVYVWYMFDC